MAQRTTKRRSPGSSNGRRASQKTEKYRFAQNVDGEETVAEREYRSYAAAGRDDPGADPDVLLDIPVVKVDSIHFELDNLDAHVALKAQVLDLVTLNVGVDGEAVEEIGEGAEGAVQDVGQGAGNAVGELGEGAGQAAGQLGEGAGEAVGQVGQGAGDAAGQLGQGAGQAVGDVGEGAGEAAGNLDQAVGGLGQAAGQVAGGAGHAAGQVAGGAGQAAGEIGQAPAGVVDSASQAAGGKGQLAKEMARTVAKEIGSAAADEAKDVSMAATRKVHELGERRRQRRAEKLNATDAALRVAQELEVDIDEVEGTGADGRITVKDVRDARES